MYEELKAIVRTDKKYKEEILQSQERIHNEDCLIMKLREKRLECSNKIAELIKKISDS